MTSIRALTLWQPWASLLAVGIKRHETRSWRIPPKVLGTRIAIHAGSGRAPETMISPELAEICDREFGTEWRASLPKGRILCTCVLGADLATEDEIDRADADDVTSGIWSPGRHAWRIDDLRPVHHSGPVSGKQGLWTWHHDGSIDIVKGEREP